MAHLQHQSCVKACEECAEACEHCASGCLNETDVKMMAECIRLDRDCAEVCWLAAGFMSRGSTFSGALCRVCTGICEACGAESAKHEHCQRCAEACRLCAVERRKMGLAA